MVRNAVRAPDYFLIPSQGLSSSAPGPPGHSGAGRMERGRPRPLSTPPRPRRSRTRHIDNHDHCRSPSQRLYSCQSPSLVTDAILFSPAGPLSELANRFHTDPFRALREPDRRRRDEERLSRSEQRTGANQKRLFDRKSPIQVRIRFPPALSPQRTMDAGPVTSPKPSRRLQPSHGV